MGDTDESVLRWLHLSDLQIGTRGSLLTQAEFRRAFERDLADMHDETGPWDFVALTGDITRAARVREYELATQILSELWSFFGSLGSRPTLLVVPGNHDDMSGGDGDGADAPGLASTDHKALRARFETYSAWRAEWERAQRDTLPRAAGAAPGDFVARARRGELSVGIIGLNTGLVPDRQSRARAIPEQVSSAAGGPLPAWSRQHQAVLLLSHRGPARWVDGIAGLAAWSSVPTVVLTGGAVRDLDGGVEADRRAVIDLEHRTIIQAGPTILPGLTLHHDGPVRCGYRTGALRLVDGGLELHTRQRRWYSVERGFVDPFDVRTSAEPIERRVGTTYILSRGAELAPIAASPSDARGREPSGSSGLRGVASGDEVRSAVAYDRTLVVREPGQVPWETPLGDVPNAMAMSPGGSYLAVRYAAWIEVFDLNKRDSVEAFDVPGRSRQVPVWVGDDRYAYDSGDHLIVRMVGTNLGEWFTGDRIRHPSGTIRAMAAASDHRCLAYGNARGVLAVSWNWPQHVVEEFPGQPVHGLAWRRDGSRLAVAHDGGLSVVAMGWSQPGWRPPKDEVSEAPRGNPAGRVAIFETQGPIHQVVWSPDERFVAGVTAGVVSLCVRAEDASGVPIPMGLRVGDDTWKQVWEAAESAGQQVHAARTVTAKVVLLGEANAGKSSLALRLAEGRFAELGATHGMQFWPVTAGALDASVEAPAGERREVVLWDMGGQDEYRLLHRAFLRDTTVAVFVFEPRRGAVAFDELEAWMAQLRDRATVVKLLVASKLDDEQAPRDAARAAALVADGTFHAYLETSATTPLGIAQLGAAIARAIDWSALGVTVRLALFQRIRDYVTIRRESGRVVMSYLELEEVVRQREGDAFDRRAVDSVVDAMNRQGFIADLLMAEGTRMLVLDVSQVERYGGSLILAARDNPRGVPALDRATVTAPDMDFPRIPRAQRLPRDQELVVLDAVITTFIQHGIAFPSSGMLIFPSLFRSLGGEPPPAVGISTRFDFVGASDVAYAALVSALAMHRAFGPPRLWPEQAEFASAFGVCGLRRSGTDEQRRRGRGSLELFFSLETSAEIRHMFVGVAESLLGDLGVSVEERPAVVCACGRRFEPHDVRERLDGGKDDIGCPACDHRTPLLPDAGAEVAGGPIAPRIRAFRTELEQRRSEAVSATKADLNNARKEHDMPGPIRILHLSDLHIGAADDVATLLQPLLTDLRDAADGLGERLDYLVISGDLTNRATSEEFANARAFVEELLAEIEVSAERCIVVPGNHDQSWGVPNLYPWVDGLDEAEIDPVTHVRQGDGWLVRNDDVYPNRFAAFTDHFLHPLCQRRMALDPAHQGDAVLFDDHRLQFLTFNSSWQIDKWFRERSGLHEGSVARTITAADKAVRDSRAAGRLTADARVLRLAVWHHPLTGNEKMVDDAFAEGLRKAGVTACLHGHIHEERADVVGYVHPTRKLHVIGAGSFAAPDAHRPPSTPQLYNVLEIAPDRTALRVHTRAKRRGPGAWAPWAVWPGGGPGERRSWYEIPL